MANRRIYYAIEQVGIAPLGTTTFAQAHCIEGCQSVGINTRFELEQVFELGQVNLYQQVEVIPDIEITLEKVLDGNALMYHLATAGAADSSLVGRTANTKNQFAMSIYPDTFSAASGTPLTTVFCSGVYISQIGYAFPVQGASTEQISLVGNNKMWGAPGITFGSVGKFANNNDVPAYSGGVAHRWDFVWAPPPGATSTKYTILPTNIEGVSSSGTNDKNANGDYAVHVQNIRTSVNLGREQLREIGRRGNYYRYVQFPVEIRTEIEIMGVSGDMVQALELGTQPDGTNQGKGYKINIKTNEGTFIDLGSQNLLESVTYGGGNASNRGGNVTETYTYQTWNQFTVLHPADPMGFSGF